jgi:hypothetical protein
MVAMMQLECRGYARLHWQSLVVDTSRQFAPIATAIRIAEIAGLHVSLFNFSSLARPELAIGLWSASNGARGSRSTARAMRYGAPSSRPESSSSSGMAADLGCGYRDRRTVELIERLTARAPPGNHS